jgi:hypothetical protein
LAADSAHKLRAVMDDDWYACMMSLVWIIEVENRTRLVCFRRSGCSNVSHV